MKTIVVHDLTFLELKNRVEKAVVSILKCHKGNTAYISLRQVIRKAGLPSYPVFNTLIIDALKELKKLNVNGRTWKLAEMSTFSNKIRFIYRTCVLITDFLEKEV